MWLVVKGLSADSGHGRKANRFERFRENIEDASVGLIKHFSDVKYSKKRESEGGVL